MALQCYVDAFNIGTGAVASTVIRTGYGFQPKACIYYWAGHTSATDTSARMDIKAGIGVATSATDRRCVTVQSDDGPTNMATDRKHNNAQCIECLTTAGAVDGNADLQSFDAGGQTLVIDDQFTTDLRVMCLALGGSDITNVATFQLQAPTATGNADFTGLSFQPDAILLFSAGITTAPPSTATSHLLSIGAATGTAQAVFACMDVDAGGNSATGSYSQLTECVALMASATSITFRASFVSFLSNGFRLNWVEVTTGQPYIFGLALKGGSYLVGDISVPATLNATQVETGFGFQPSGALFLTDANTVPTADVSNTNLYASIGAMSSASNRGAQGWNSAHNTTTAQCTTAVDHDAVLVVPGNAVVVGLVDVQSVESDGFTTIVDLAMGGAVSVWYLACGSSGGAPAQKAPPPRRSPLRFSRRVA